MSYSDVRVQFAAQQLAHGEKTRRAGRDQVDFHADRTQGIDGVQNLQCCRARVWQRMGVEVYEVHGASDVYAFRQMANNLPQTRSFLA